MVHCYEHCAACISVGFAPISEEFSWKVLDLLIIEPHPVPNFITIYIYIEKDRRSYIMSWFICKLLLFLHSRANSSPSRLEMSVEAIGMQQAPASLLRYSFLAAVHSNKWNVNVSSVHVSPGSAFLHLNCLLHAEARRAETVHGRRPRHYTQSTTKQIPGAQTGVQLLKVRTTAADNR